MKSLASFTKSVRAKKVLIDSNIIIYLTDSIKPYASISQQLFSMVESGETHAVMSILTINEVMQGPMKKGNTALAMEVKEYLTNFPNSICQEITYEVLEMIGQDNRIAWEQLRTIDTLIIASGLLNGVDLFISNDIHFAKAIPAEMRLSFSEMTKER